MNDENRSPAQCSAERWTGTKGTRFAWASPGVIVAVGVALLLAGIGLWMAIGAQSPNLASAVLLSIGGVLIEIPIAVILIDRAIFERRKLELLPFASEAQNDASSVLKSANGFVRDQLKILTEHTKWPPIRMGANLQKPYPFLDHSDKLMARYQAVMEVYPSIREQLFALKSYCEMVDREVGCFGPDFFPPDPNMREQQVIAIRQKNDRVVQEYGDKLPCEGIEHLLIGPTE